MDWLVVSLFTPRRPTLILPHSSQLYRFFSLSLHSSAFHHFSRVSYIAPLWSVKGSGLNVRGRAVKGIVHTKGLFCHVITNLYHMNSFFCGTQKKILWIMLVIKQFHLLPLYGQNKLETKPVWLSAFFKISSSVFCTRCIQVWNDMNDDTILFFGRD